MIPQGWERKPIKDVCDSIIDCVNKTAPVVDYKTPFKMLRTTNIRDGRVNTEDVRYVTEDVYKEWVRRGAPKVGDLIFTREAPVGEVGVLEDDKGIFLGQRTMMYRANLQKADNYFLFYSLQSLFCQKQIEDFSNGGTVSHMRVPDCGEIIVNIPSLPEQKKIAQILSTWDKAITTTEQLLANSQQQKKALMQQLLTGKRRLKGVGGEFKRSHLSDLVKIDAKSLGNKTPTDFKFRYISLSDVNAGRIADNLDCHKFHNAPSRARRIVSEGDILLATVRPNLQGFAKITKEYSDCIASTGFSVLSPKKGVCGSYLYHYLFGAHITGQINALVVGTNYPAINSSDVAGLLIYYPEYEEQEKIAEILNNCDSILSVLQQKLEGLKQEKKALMQQLLTGKRRVKA
jgi:type I restriction enzyme S subunit